MKKIGTGASSRRDERRAVEEASRQALARLRPAKPSFGFVFASTRFDLPTAMADARRETGCADLLGSSTAGEFTEEGRLDQGCVVMLVASHGARHRLEFGRGLRDGHGALAARFADSALQLKQAERSSGRRHLTTVLLTNGLAGTGEELVADMFQKSTSVQQIVGGASGDDGRFKETFVAAGTECASDAVAALQVCDSAPWGIGVDHGLRPTTRPMRVTSSQGSVLHTIEGQPAFEIYRRHALQRGVLLHQDSAASYMIENELGVHFFSALSRARAPLAVREDGSLVCAAPVPEGSFVSILDGEPASMVAAAKSAAEEARSALGHMKVAGVLLFDCVCRGMILKSAFAREIEAVRSIFRDVPIAGFLTYGEIARYAGRLEGWHNATVVVAAIPG